MRNQRVRKIPSPGLARPRGPGVLVLCYGCAVVMTLLLVCGAALWSFSLTLTGRQQLEHLAGSYSAVLLQQKEVQQALQALGDRYGFHPEPLGKQLDSAALSRFSQDTLNYWYGLTHGNAAQGPPRWDPAPMAQALEADAAFAARWQAQGVQKVAAQAAQELADAVQNAVSPMQALPARLARLSARGYEARAAAWGIVLLLLAAVPAVMIRLLQPARPFQSLWFWGTALGAASLGILALLLALKGFPLEGLLARYSPLLALYGVFLLGRLRAMLSAFGGACALAGMGLLVPFFILRHKRISTTHHELSSFF